MQNAERIFLYSYLTFFLCHRSSTAVNLYSWSRVSVFRVNQFGSVSVNAGTPSRGYSDGDLKELNLPMTLYLGGYSGEYNPQAGVVSGLLGAVQRVYRFMLLLLLLLLLVGF